MQLIQIQMRIMDSESLNLFHQKNRPSIKNLQFDHK